MEAHVSNAQENGERTQFVTSRDGTRIAYEKIGSGPPLLVVNGALGFRAMSFAKQLRTEFAKYFTVIDYDRRGRGESGDQRSYSVDREIGDIDVLVRQAAGGACYVFAQSSGATLALRAAAAGVPMKALVAYEPPFMVGNPRDRPAADYRDQVTALIATGQRDEAVRYFMRTVGVPGFFVALMRLFPFWKQLRSSAHTLPYDAEIMGDFELPARELAAIDVPVVAAAGDNTTPTLKRAVQAVAEIVPGAQRQVAPKMSHAIKPALLAPLLREWLDLAERPTRQSHTHV
jgi:pimeloyl-ACP methyl ester carboxylesterase